MKKGLLFVMISLLFLTGCSENLAIQSMRWAIESIEEGNYKEARSYIAFAQNEGKDPEYEALYAQMQSLILMVEELEAGNFDEALLRWTDINLIKTESEVIKEVAVDTLKEMLSEMIVSCEAALETGDYETEKGMINQVVKRLGDMKLFEGQMTQLRQLRRQMN